MGCKHPLTGVCLGRDPTTGKKIIKVLSIDYKEQISNDPNIQYIPIPCGHCIDCRLSKSREWAARCMFETKEYENNYFVTLTYDNEHLPRNEYLDQRKDNLGEIPDFLKKDEYDNPWLQLIHDASISESLDEVVLDPEKIPYIHPLVYRDVQLFIKRVRSYFRDNNIKADVRYFGCGEYGSNTLRPHWHIIFYDLPLDDLQVRKIDQTTGYIYYTSKFLESKWENGFVLITQVEYDCCAYVAGYVLKKQYGRNAEIYEQLHITPEMSFMSRRPGIGKRFYDAHKNEIYKNDLVLVTKGEKSYFSKPPKYFDRLFDDEQHEIMEFIRARRSDDMEMSLEHKKNNHSGTYSDILRDEETNQIARTKILKERSKVNETLI